MRRRRPIPARATSKLPEPDINVTPLVDVVLVLLIIFMVVTPKLAQNPVVALPSAKTIDQRPKTANAIDVVLKRDRTLLVEDASVARANLLPRLADLRRVDHDRGVLLEADAALPYGEVRSLFAELQSSGTRGIALKVIQRKE